MNAAHIIERFLTGTYTVTRRGPTTVGADGRADAATPSTFTIRASVQALGGRELQRLPEGLRVAERRRVYTTTRLQDLGAPDVVSIDGEAWQVENVETWETLGNFFKAIVAKVGD